jgi:pimeloyl-ACP methyl ester carboxylesterase
MMPAISSEPKARSVLLQMLPAEPSRSKAATPASSSGKSAKQTMSSSPTVHSSSRTPPPDHPKRRSLHNQLRDSIRDTGLLGSAEHALRGPLAGKPLVTTSGAKNDPFGFEPRWRELFPDAVQHVVDGGHHFPTCDDPELCARALRGFLT